MPLNVPIDGILDEPTPGGNQLVAPGNPIVSTNRDAASSVNTQTAVRNRELSNILNMPIGSLNDDEDFAKQQHQAIKDESNRELAPASSDFRNISPENYALTKDDADEISIMEHTLRGAGSLVGGAVDGLGRIPSGFGRLFGEVRDSFREAVLTPVKLLNPELAANISTAVDDLNSALPWWTDPGLSLEQMGADVKGVGKQLTPDDPAFHEQVLGGVGQLGAQIAVILATGGIGGTTALYAQGADITGEKLDQTREDGKEAEKWEGLAIMLGAGVSGVTEKYGIDNLIRRIPNGIRSRIVRILAGAGSEATQEVLEDVGQNLVIMGFDPSRTPEGQDILEQASVAGAVGAIASALIPGRKRAVQTKVVMDHANDKAENLSINESDPDTAKAMKEQAVMGAGITGASVNVRHLIEYAKGNDKAHPLMAALKTQIQKAMKSDNKNVILSAKDFATLVFGTEHYNKLGDHMTYFLKEGVNRNRLTAAEAVNEIKENATKIKGKIEEAIKDKGEENLTLRERTLKFLDKFVKGEDVDLNEILLKAPADVVTHMDQLLGEIKQEGVIQEEEIKAARIREVTSELTRIDESITDVEIQIQARKDSGKKTKRLENRLEKLLSQENILRAEETLLDRVLPVPERYKPKVGDKAKVPLRTERLRELNVKADKQSVRAARSVFRKGVAGAKENIVKGQEIITAFITNSGLDTKKKGEYIQTIKGIKDLDELQAKLPEIQARVLKDLDRQRKAQVKGAIKKIVKKGVKANTNPAVNDLLKQAKEILNLPVAAAKERLDNTDLADPILNNLLALRAGSPVADVDFLEDLLLDLDTTVEGGRAIGVANLLHRTAQREELRQKVQAAIGPKPEADLTVVQERVQAGIGYAFLGWSGSWRNKLQHIFSSKNAKGVNKLLEELSLFKESRAHDVNSRKTVEKFQGLVQNKTKMTQKQITSQWNKDNSVRVNLGKFTMADGTVHELRRTKAELRMVYMQALNPDIKETFTNVANDGGFTEAVFEAIKGSFTSFDKQMIDSQLEFYADYYDRINLAYRNNYGLNLPKVEQYVPVRRDFGDGQGSEEFLRSILYRGGPKPASLQARKPGARQRVKRAGDITTMQSHMIEMEYFIAYAEKVNTLRAVFTGNNNEVMNLIADRYGRKIAHVVSEDLTWFATKGAMNATATDDILIQLMRNFGFAQLGAKPQIGLKQLASFSAFAQDVSPVEFSKALTHLATPAGWKKAVALMNKSSFFRGEGHEL